MLLTRSPLYVRPKAGLIVRLACVRHAASVHPEPGSNSPFDLGCRFPVRGNRRVSINSKNKSEFKEVPNKWTLWHVSICLPRRISQMPSVRHSIRFSRCRRARAQRSRLVAAQERTIPAIRMPCQGKFSRNFSDPSAGAREPSDLARLASRPASRASAAGVSYYTSPRRFVKGVIRKIFGAPSIPLAAASGSLRRLGRAAHHHSTRPYLQTTAIRMDPYTEKEGDPEGSPSLSTIGGCDLTQRLLSAEHRTRKYRRQAWLARLPRA